MADDKNKKKEGEDKKKGPLIPLILVSVGAALGGGGVVMFTKPPDKHVADKPKPKEYLKVKTKEEMAFTFNPVKERGTSSARFRLKFVYLVEKKNEGKAHESLRNRWDLAYDRCLEVLTGSNAKELKSPEGKQRLKRRLVDELTIMLFPEDPKTEARVAQVQTVLFLEYFFQ